MKTILVDDELWMLQQFEEECSQLPEIEVAGTFSFAEDALVFAKNNLVEFALLDIEMPGMNGVDLAKELRKLYPEVIIVFVTGHKEYLSDFIDMKADYYVLKPYGKKDVKDVLERARLYSARLKKRVSIRTFGQFEVFIDGKPLYFKVAKAKEILALMVDLNGSILTSREALTKMWENKEYDYDSTSVYRVNLKRLRDILKEAGVPDIVVQVEQRGNYLDTGKVDCDLYRFLEGDKNAIKAFGGEYMSGYSWGEETLAQLVKMADGNR